ncbi:hypothetical protein CRENBAI_022720 [Crenichthys baileyi]|uniref:Uncharacterized protein n=1 Tax=Crenichthys baileyi TaxID=28760 RepID=A0AAV9SGV3_9TELE
MDRPEDPSTMSSSDAVLGTASEKMTEGNRMDDCGSTEEMDVPTEENNEGGNQAGGPTVEPPSQVNQDKNNSAEPITCAAMETDTQPRGGKKPSSEKSRRGQDLQAKKTGRCSMKCPTCGFNIVPSVKFVKEKNEQWEFNIDLHKEIEDAPFFTDKLAFPKQATDTKVNCPNCKYSFLYKMVATNVNNKRGGFDIDLSIKIPKDVQQKDRTGDDQPASLGNSGSKTDESSWWKLSWNKFPEGNLFNIKTSARSNPTIKVCCIKTAEALGADDAIMKEVKNSKQKSAEVEKTSVDECSLIIIFCPVSLGCKSDVISAMKDTRVSSSGKPVILVLMHHTRDVDYFTAGFNWCSRMLHM